MRFVLVVTMVMAGQDLERHEPVGSLSECWERAARLMSDLLEQREVHTITKIGIGCVFDAGDPA